MKNKRKRMYYERYMDDIESENQLLKQENKRLKTLNECNQETINEMKKEHDEVLKEYRDGLEEIKELKKKYNEMIRSAYIAKKEYSDKMLVLIKRLKNSNV